MLMFQQKSACDRTGSSRQLHEIHVADRIGGVGGELRCGEVGLVDPARLGPVEVEEARARLAEIARDGRQERAGADDVAAGPLALEALPEPEQRGPSAVELGCLLDQVGRNARCVLAPLRRAACEQRFQLVPADRVRPDEVHVDEPVAGDHVQEREGQGGVAAGERLEVEIGCLGRRGPHRVDHDHPGGRLGQPVVVCVRRRSRRIRAPDENAGGVAGGQRVEADEGGAVHVLERDVPGLVADRVRVDLGRAQPVEEAQRKEVGEEREGARVVGVQDRVRAGGRLDATETLGDLLERIVPGDGLEPPVALRAGRGEAGASAAPPDRERSRCSRSSTCGRACRGSPHAPDRRGRCRIAPSRLTTAMPHAS